MNAIAENYCRICLDNECTLNTIYTSREQRYLPSVIYNISGVKLLPQKEPHAKICKKCAPAVLAAESIILECQEAEEFLSEQQKQFLNKGQTTWKDKEQEPTNSVAQVPSNKAVASPQQQLEIELCATEVAQDKNTNISEHVTIKNINEINKLQSYFVNKLRSKRLLKHDTSVGRQPPKHECQHCAYRTTSRQCLVTHYHDVHQLDERNMYACHMCTETFSWRRTLFMHLEKVHKILPSEKHFLCEECGKAYFKKRFLEDHIAQRHSNVDSNSSNRFKCPQPGCSKTFNRKFTLNRHFESIHVRVQRYQCKMCTSTFCSLDKWRYHIESAHQRKYCPRCGSWFRKQSILDAHLASDRCVKCIYQCPRCPRRFVTKRGVKVHLENSCKTKDKVVEPLLDVVGDDASGQLVLDKEVIFEEALKDDVIGGDELLEEEQMDEQYIEQELIEEQVIDENDDFLIEELIDC